MWNFQTPLLTEEHTSLLKGNGTSVMETFSLELHHNIMLANKCCLYCKPVVAPMRFSLGRNCACVYMSVHVLIQNTPKVKENNILQYKWVKTIPYYDSANKVRISDCYTLENGKNDTLQKAL